jgi:hypothetical protein
LGAGHIQFEVFFHGLTSWIEVEDLVEIPICGSGNDKNCLMSRKIGFHNGPMFDDLGLGKGQDFVIFASNSDLRLVE